MNRKNPVVEIRKTVRGASPRIPFESIARAILPERYELSLVICSDTLAARMNHAYRKKRHAANVLSFPLSVREGEIFLNIRAAAREAKQFNVSFQKHLAFLFIHACLHLKGYDHGKKMDKLEQLHLKKAGL